MKYNEQEVDELVKDALNYIDREDGHDSFVEWNKFKESAEKFREPKAARVLSHEGILYVEKTDAVIARVGPTAGVNRLNLSILISEEYAITKGKMDEIMQLIADAAPEVEG